MSQSTKVLILAGIYPPQSGGPAVYAKMLFDNSGKYGVEYLVLPLSAVQKHTDINIFWGRFVYFLRALKMGWQSNIIFALDPVSVGFPAMFASLFLFKKLVLRIAGDYAWEQGTDLYGVTESLDTFAAKKSGYPFKVLLFKFVQTTIARFAKKIIVPSLYLKKIVSAWGINQNKIEVIYNGFILEDGLQSKEELRSKLNIKQNSIISVSRLVPWKGFKTLIEAMPKVLEVYNDATLTIIGDGPDEEMLKSKISELKLEDSVLMLGRLSHLDVLKYIKAADLFVLNTNYEGLSHLLLEAMGLGTPIITTNVGGNTELIEDRKGGVLINYNNKEALYKSIIELLSNKSLAYSYAAISKQRSEGFSSIDTVKNTAEFFLGLR